MQIEFIPPKRMPQKQRMKIQKEILSLRKRLHNAIQANNPNTWPIVRFYSKEILRKQKQLDDNLAL